MILRGDHLQAEALTVQLVTDCRSDLRVEISEPFVQDAHG